MKRLKISVVGVIGLAAVLVSSVHGADLVIGPRAWVNTDYTYTYYLNNNFNTNGNLMACYLNDGPSEFDSSSGAVVNLITNVNTKSSLALDGYVFWAGPQSAASVIRRMDNSWDLDSLVTHPALDENNDSVGPSSICTDGTNIYTCSYYATVATNMHCVNAYAVDNEEESFTLTHLWSAPLGTDGCIRGFGYSQGYLYASPGGKSGLSRRVYAIRASDGTVIDMNLEVPGAGVVYDIIRYNDLLLVAAASDLFVWDMTSDTSVDAGSLDQYGSELLGTGNNAYGIAYDGTRLYVASGAGSSKLQAFFAKPRPQGAIIKSK